MDCHIYFTLWLSLLLRRCLFEHGGLTCRFRDLQQCKCRNSKKQLMAPIFYHLSLTTTCFLLLTDIPTSKHPPSQMQWWIPQTLTAPPVVLHRQSTQPRCLIPTATTLRTQLVLASSHHHNNKYNPPRRRTHSLSMLVVQGRATNINTNTSTIGGRASMAETNP